MVDEATRDYSLDTLLELDGQVLVVDPAGRHWVRFAVRRVAVSPDWPHGLSYSLTLHGPDGERLVGFDNQHAVRPTAGPSGRGGARHDHKHRLRTVRPYEYTDAAALLADFLGRGRHDAEGAGGNAVSTLRIGIASFEEMKRRTVAIARGEHRPERAEPKVWFTSIESFARVLSDRNRALLRLIAEKEPGSLAELASLSGRATSNLSRTLRTMERYGLVRLEQRAGGRVVPHVAYTDVAVDVPIST